MSEKLTGRRHLHGVPEIRTFFRTNQQRDLAAVDVWAQLIMKEPHDSVERILAAPRTGIWQSPRRRTSSHGSTDCRALRPGLTR